LRHRFIFDQVIIAVGRHRPKKAFFSFQGAWISPGQE
jgi:phosphopantetheine adenylyltransferase